jgi:UDP-4-amino-4,6-dideoxy-N-acetyl-beta-L-altrosamine transaminase
MKYIPYGHQTIDDEDIQAVISVLKGDWLTQGPLVSQFEEAIAEYVGVRYAVSFANGTAALHGAYYAAGLQDGDEVITSPITFAATSNAAVYLGGSPVFADISPDTYCIDLEAVSQRITSKTKVIAPVSYAGFPVDIHRLRAIADETGAIIIEDGCHALGATRDGRKVGSEADMTVFSFHPVKHITTGEGGMVVTDNPLFAERLRLFRSHGITKDEAKMERQSQGPWYAEMIDLGYNYRLTDLQSALGFSQLKKLDRFLEKRRSIAQRYNAALATVENIKRPPSHPGHAYHLYPLWVEPSRRKHVFEFLREHNIGAQVHYIPVYLHPYYMNTFGFKSGECPCAEHFYAGEISLPIFPALAEHNVEYVCDKVKEAVC